MAVKPTKPSEYKEVTYTTSRWRLLSELRGEAIKVMTALEAFHLPSITHGSIARGDVRKGSDVDIFIGEIQSSFMVETALENAGVHVNARYIIQATPTYAMKAHIEVSERITVSFPLMQMRTVEREFYRFGGEANSQQLKADTRVTGVDKRLMLIEPTKGGHVESSVIGREQGAAKVLGVSAETVLDRVHTLIKRDTAGRTGVFVKKELASDETFELALKKLADLNPAVRRRMKK
jgi:hypothetical protein